MNPDTNFGGLKAKKKDHYAHVKSGMSDFVKTFIYSISYFLQKIYDREFLHWYAMGKNKNTTLSKDGIFIYKSKFIFIRAISCLSFSCSIIRRRLKR